MPKLEAALAEKGKGASSARPDCESVTQVSIQGKKDEERGKKISSWAELAGGS